MISFTDHYNAIYIDRPPSKTKIGKDYKNFSYKNFFSLKKTPHKTSAIQQVTNGNAPNLVLKRMLRYFLKIPPLKNFLQLHHRICFFIKDTKQQRPFSK